MQHKIETEKVLASLTIEEKAALLSGKNEWESHDIRRLDVPSITFSDGPSGVRRQEGKGDHLGLNASVPATCFPSSATVANSWDPSLAEQVGEAIGREAAALGVDVLLGPGMNMKRSPLCGRNFEYFSEDPYLTGKLAAAYVRGVQKNGVSACVKHFAVNNQEERRMAMNAVVDERTLRELYLTAFEIAIAEGEPGSLMTSYNEVNGTYANENPHLIQEILREEWDYDGLVITDWGGSNDHCAAVAAGSDLEMPCPGFGPAREILKALEEGTLTEQQVDARVRNILDMAFTAREEREKREKTDREELLRQNHKTAAMAAAQSAVLLKNEGALLPLCGIGPIAVIGDFAREPRYQGAGSSAINTNHLETLFDVLEEYGMDEVTYAQGYRRNSAADETLEQEAVKTAGNARLILYFFGLDEISESEGMDRRSMKIPDNQIRLLRRLSSLGTPVVGILSGGAAVEMPWEETLQALLYTGLGGEAGIRGVMDILTGRVNPSGKLSETYPMTLEETPVYGNFGIEDRDTVYREGLYVGYRYYDTAKRPVRYPFGYGLSYTVFTYSDLKITRTGVSFRIQNTGKRAGAEIAQLYVHKEKAMVYRPEQELKGFCKVFLNPGEAREVEIPFDDYTFRFFHTGTNSWETEGGIWEIRIGASSRDIRLQGETEVAGTVAEERQEKALLPHYRTGQIQKVTEEELCILFGEAFVSRTEEEVGTYRELTANDALSSMICAKSALARLAARILLSKKDKSEKAGKPDLNILFICNMPFRAMAKMTQGMVNAAMVSQILRIVNGHFLSGFAGVIREYFRNRRQERDYERKLKGNI